MASDRSADETTGQRGRAVTGDGGEVVGNGGAVAVRAVQGNGGGRWAVASNDNGQAITGWTGGQAGERASTKRGGGGGGGGGGWAMMGRWWWWDDRAAEHLRA